MIWFIVVLLVLAAAYLLSLRGRKGHPGMAELRAWRYAHRGLHGEGRPENSMPAFRAAMEHGYGVELDVHLMKDGNLAVIHDSSLKRTAGADVKVEDLTVADLSRYFLQGTQQNPPLLQDVLSLFDGKVPMIVELKCVDGNYAALCETACRLMEAYPGPFCMESFDPRCLLWLKKHRPHIIRGQLAENWLKAKNFRLPWILKFILATHICNFITQPDFIAYKFADRNMFGTEICRKLWGVQGVSWTIRTQEEFDIALEGEWIPIFEGFEP